MKYRLVLPPLLVLLASCSATGDAPLTVVEAGEASAPVVEPEVGAPQPEQVEPDERQDVAEVRPPLVSASVAAGSRRRLSAPIVMIEAGPRESGDLALVRWSWSDGASATGRPVRVSSVEQERSVVAGLHRIAASEVEWSSDADMVGIWQVLRAVNRSRAALDCDRARLRHITECAEGGGETMLSSMRRASSRVMGARDALGSRQRWIRSVSLSCGEPDGYPARRSWSRMVGRCERAARLAASLVADGAVRGGPLPAGVVPVAWGGRCDVRAGACDDAIACRRGLSMIPGTPTRNAFWCRPGRGGCPGWVEVDGGWFSGAACARSGVRARRAPSGLTAGAVRAMSVASVDGISPR